MADGSGRKKSACHPLKGRFWFRAQAQNKKVQATPFIKGRTTRIESPLNQLGSKESLRSKLAPHQIGKAEDSVYLGWARGLPLVNKSYAQFCVFPHIFAWDCGKIDKGEGAMLLCVRAFRLAVTMVARLCCWPFSSSAISMTAICRRQ
jgi:hypothetical protein